MRKGARRIDIFCPAAMSPDSLGTTSALLTTSGSAELMVPKWFSASVGGVHACNADVLLASLRSSVPGPCVLALYTYAGKC